MSVLATPPGDRLQQPGNVHTLNSVALAREGFFIKNDVSVNAAIPQAILDTFDPNPILDISVPGITEISLESVRSTPARQDSSDRTHRLYTLTLDGYRHALELTDPSHSEPEYVVLSFPGFTECIEGDFRREMHAQLAKLHPSARIVSIASNGIGPTGDRYKWGDRLLHGINAMGEQRHILARALSRDLPVLGVHTSMGTRIGHRLAEQNVYEGTPHGKINLMGQVLISPALVDPYNIPKDMAVSFIPGMILDIATELGLKSSPAEIVRIIRSAGRYALGREDGIALANQLLDLLAGISEARVSSVVAETPTVVVAGSKDSLAQWKMWERIQGHHSHNLFLKIILGRGHALGMKPEKAARQSCQIGKHMLHGAIDLSELRAA